MWMSTAPQQQQRRARSCSMLSLFPLLLASPPEEDLGLHFRNRLVLTRQKVQRCYNLAKRNENRVNVFWQTWDFSKQTSGDSREAISVGFNPFPHCPFGTISDDTMQLGLPLSPRYQGTLTYFRWKWIASRICCDKAIFWLPCLQNCCLCFACSFLLRQIKEGRKIVLALIVLWRGDVIVLEVI